MNPIHKSFYYADRTWLGEIPSRWSVAPIKRLGSVVLGKMLQSSSDGSGDTLAPYLRAANVQPDGVLALDDVKSMWFRNEELAELCLHRGDVVVVEGGQGGFGRAAFVAENLDRFGFQNSINRIRPRDGNDGRFIAYALIAARSLGWIHAFCNVVSMPHFTAEKVDQFTIALPPPDEQRAIANYLDRETAKIDKLIDKQKQLIETLRERRSKFLDRLLESIGAAESDWLPLKHLCQMVTVGIVIQPSRWYVADGVPALRGLNVRPERIDLNELIYISNEGHATHSKSRLTKGDVLVVRTGQTGVAAVVPPALDGANAIDLLIARPKRCLDSGFLAMILNASSFRDRAATDTVGTIQGHLNVAALRQIRVPFVGIEAQREALAEWRRYATGVDALVGKANRFIELARERRAVLIAAAVTGKIDVREQPTESVA